MELILPFFAVLAIFGVTHSYVTDLNSLTLGSKATNPCSNSPTTRRCWANGYNIDTSYYQSWPFTGRTRRYTLVISNNTISPDGVEVDALLVNGTYPGPQIWGDWGDKFEVTIINQLPVNGTSIHFHGLRQLHSNQNDGVPGVTQCPIPPGGQMTYRFQATEYGTSWYHSHFSVQYAAGILGPLIIKGPATANYDRDNTVIMLTDWTHGSVFGALVGTVDAYAFYTEDDGLMSGHNIYHPHKSGAPTSAPAGKEYYTTTVTPGHRVRVRLINTSTQAFWRFTIDNHNLTVIANDFVPIVPYETDNIVVGPGQRHDILIYAGRKLCNYWIRAISASAGAPAPHQQVVYGILNYAGVNSSTLPTSTSAWSNDSIETSSEEFLTRGTPHVALNVGPRGIADAVDLNHSAIVNLWTMNGSSMLLDWADPTALNVYNKVNLTTFQNGSYSSYNDPNLPARFDLPKLYNGTVFTSRNIWRVDAANEWVYFVINNYATNDVHPMHLHGHDFWILSQGRGIYDASTMPLRTTNPPRRDVANILPKGHLVIAFYTDNPGLWLLHCHIAWHVSEGLSLQWLERESEILQYYNTTALKSGCDAWNSYTTSEVWGQDDTGV